MLIQHFIHCVFQFLRILRQGDELLWPAVHLSPLKVHDAAAQCFVGGFLLGCHQGGAHIQAARVSISSVLRKHQLAHHFSHVFGVHQAAGGGGFDLKHLFLCRFRL